MSVKKKGSARAEPNEEETQSRRVRRKIVKKDDKKKKERTQKKPAKQVTPKLKPSKPLSKSKAAKDRDVDLQKLTSNLSAVERDTVLKQLTASASNSDPNDDSDHEEISLNNDVRREADEVDEALEGVARRECEDEEDEEVEEESDNEAIRPPPEPVIDDSDDEQLITIDKTQVNGGRENDDKQAAVDLCDDDEIPGPAQTQTADREVDAAVIPQYEARTIRSQDDVYQHGSFDQSGMRNLLRTMKEDIISDVKSAVATTLNNDKVYKLESAINRMQENLDNVSSVVTMTASMLMNKAGTAVPKQKELKQALCILRHVFNNKLFTKIMTKCFVGKFSLQLSSANMATQQKVGSDLLSILIFSKKSKEKKKDKFSSQLGQQYSQYRHGLMLSAFLIVQHNRFGSFLTDEEEKAAMLVNLDVTGIFGNPPADGKLFSDKIAQPKWLEVGFITSVHCDDVAKKAEHRICEDEHDSELELSSSTSRLDTESGSQSNVSEDRVKKSSSRGKQGKKNQLTDDIIATEAVSMVYRIITNVLHKGRDACKIQMFHELLYLFTGWSQFKVSVDQSSLHMKWKAQASRDVDYLESIPFMREIKPQDRIPSKILQNDAIDNDNLRLMTKFISDHPEMTIVVHHDVVVNGSTRSLRHHINMVEVASKVVGAYGMLDTNSQSKHVLSSDRGCLKVIVVIAIAIRHIVNQTLKQLNDGEPVMWLDNITPTGNAKAQSPNQEHSEAINRSKYMFPVVNGISLDYFQPPRSKQKEILGPLLLTLKQEEFEMKNEPVLPQESGVNSVDRGTVMETTAQEKLNPDAITADKLSGVFSFD